MDHDVLGPPAGSLRIARSLERCVLGGLSPSAELGCDFDWDGISDGPTTSTEIVHTNLKLNRRYH